MFATQNRSTLLAEMIPAISFAAGANPLGTIDLHGGVNLDMNNTLYKNGWPVARHDLDQANPVKHGDFKAVAYVYVYKVFDDIAKVKENLNQ